MSKRVHRHPLVDLRGLGSGMDGPVQLPGAQPVNRVETGKQPATIEHLALGAGHSPPHPQPLQQHRREHGIAILAALALLDAQGHALAVDVTDLQRTHLAGAKTCAVGDRQRRLTLQVRCGRIRRATSSRFNTTGKVRGTRTGRIFAINSPRSSVTSKKNFKPVIVALSVIGELP